MQEEDFEFFRKFLLEQSGFALERQKMYLLQGRLNPLLADHSLSDIRELVIRLRTGDQVLMRQVIEAMVTSETLFFRDDYPFDALCTTILPRLAKYPGQIRIWSAAAATGQEAYSIAMSVADRMPQILSRLSIMATDISAKALVRAKDGRYSDMEVRRGVPESLLAKFFEQDGGSWKVRQQIQCRIRFQEINLVADDLPCRMYSAGYFDVVFCRNVLIYFDAEVRRKVIDNLSRCMNVGAFLLTGGTEKPEGVRSVWQRIPVGRHYIWRLRERAR